MIQKHHKPIVLSVLIALIYWVIDAAVDSVLHYEEPFVYLLLFHKEGIFSRLLFFSGFLLIGLIMSKLIKEQTQSYESLSELYSENQKERAQTEAVLMAIGDGICILDTDYTVVFQNKAHIDIFGNQAGCKCYDAYGDNHGICHGCPLVRSFRDGKVYRGERTIHLKDKICHLEISSAPLRNSEGKIISGIEVVRDVSKRTEAERLKLETEERYRSLVNSTEDFIYLVDRQCRYVFMNEAYMKRLGLAKGQLRGQSFSAFHSPSEAEAFREKINHVFISKESSQFEHKSLRDRKFYLQTLSPVINSAGEVKAVTVISKNISQIKNLQEDMRSFTLVDKLTGLYNQRGLFLLSEYQIKLARRDSKGVQLIYITINSLREQTNSLDKYLIDLLLLDSSHIISNVFHDADIISNFGEYSFVIFQSLHVHVPAEIINTRLEKALNTYNTDTTKKYPLSFSCGITYTTTDNLHSVSEMLANAQENILKLNQFYQ